MSTMLLNKEIREDLVDAVISSAFKERKEKLKEARLQCGEDAYQAIFGPYQAQIDSCPDWFWDELSEIELVGEGKGAWYGNFPLRKPRKFPMSVRSEECRISQHPELEARVVAASKEVESLDKDERLARKQLWEALRGFRSVKQLQEKWPEVAAFLSDDVRHHYPLVVSNIQDINHRLGLSRPETEIN